MKYKKYPKYKDSGVEWIGEIPEGWEVKRFKFVFDIIKNGVWGTEPSQDNSNLICVRVADFNRNNSTVSLENQTLRNIPKKQEEKCLLVNGDLLLERSGGGEKQPVGFTVIYNHNEKAVCSNFITRLKPKDEFDSSFLNYIFSSMYYNTQNVKYIKQTTGIQNLDLEYLSQSFFFPSYEEQIQISEFLDKQTTQFDELIAKSKAQITLLEEKRQATITHVVTKGLDPSVKMKDSGVEWIGEIPEGWGIVPFKQILTQKMDNGIFKKKNQFGDGVRLVNVGDLYQEDGVVNQQTLDRVMVDDGERKKYAVIPNDIFFVRSSLKLEGIGISSIVRDIVEPIVFECHIIRTRPNQQKINPIYLKYLLNSSKFRSYFVSVSQTVTMTTISQDHIKNLKIISPPIEEQIQIEDFLEKQTTQFDELIAKSKAQITLLEEKRQALITATVTGKIDVRS